MIRRFGIVCTALLMNLMLCTVSAAATDFNRESLDSIVAIITQFTYEGEEFSESGTGFFIGEPDKNPEYFVTNYHVVMNCMENDGDLLAVFDMEQVEWADVIAYDERRDLAVLQLDVPTSLRKPAKLRETSNDLIGAAVFAIGYPVIAEETIHATSIFGKEDATVTGGRVNRILTEVETGRKLLQMDVNIRSGNSGGPLIDSEGLVVGINTLASVIDSNLNYAVSTDELVSILEGENIPFTMQEATAQEHVSSAETSAESTNVSDAQTSDAENVGSTESSASNPSASAEKMLDYQMHWAAVSITAMISGIAIVALFLLLRRKKQNSPSMQRTVIRSLSPQHNGTVFPLGEMLLAGRDVSACQIVFRENTVGVSARHCKIFCENRQVILVDLNSTYGTYLANGEKLVPGVRYPLQQGERFYLGIPENVMYMDYEAVKSKS